MKTWERRHIYICVYVLVCLVREREREKNKNMYICVLCLVVTYCLFVREKRCIGVHVFLSCFEPREKKYIHMCSLSSYLNSVQQARRYLSGPTALQLPASGRKECFFPAKIGRTFKFVLERVSQSRFFSDPGPYQSSGHTNTTKQHGISRRI